MTDGSIRDLIRGAMAEIPGSSSRLDAELLMSHVLGRSRAWLIAHDDLLLVEESVCRFQHLLMRRRLGEPMAYLLGYRDFWKGRFKVAPGCLVPRPESELLVEIALAARPDTSATLLDLGSGSGALGISLALERPEWTVVASDLYDDAVAATTANGRHVQNLVRCQGYWGSAYRDACFDIVVCNPPYIPEGDPHLASLAAEPVTALSAGADGLDDIRRVVTDAFRILKPGGTLVMEHGHDQRASVIAILTDAGYADLRTFDDLNAVPRAVSAKRV
ncbi:MAG: peptide chain release factor N(5)-glutamine methyltransferase [Proteobacteria bacterium]|jgi:release factor glutamine methyltransferase|nr:peptide chain release factor N(5)-glutamine methyltransferase [Pseudomonadota bacterium]MDA1298503.1 peptide chain release factor N(5)-glutamine methyltransferase [Pseudomonadota bacterium]